jgi:hypothetical protein
MRPILVKRSRTPVGVRCAHFFYCNHNIRGSGLKEKNYWRSVYDALIILCVEHIVAEPYFLLRLIKPDFQNFGIPLFDSFVFKSTKLSVINVKRRKNEAG